MGPHRLNAEERRAYQDDGFFVRRAVFSEPQLETLRAAAERAGLVASESTARGEAYQIDGNRYVDVGETTVQYEHRDGTGTLRVVEPFHHLDPVFEDVIDDPRLVEPMLDLVGADRVALFTDKLNFKRPREGSGFRWHQDSPYWNHFCGHVDRCPNVMIALDDADEENGCLRVVRGSHRRGSLPGLQGQGMLGPLFTDPRYFDEEAQVAAAMPAGSLLFFSPHTVHGSRPNHSPRARRAIVLTYQPAGHRMFKTNRTRDAGAARAGAQA